MVELIIPKEKENEIIDKIKELYEAVYLAEGAGSAAYDIFADHLAGYIMEKFEVNCDSCHAGKMIPLGQVPNKPKTYAFQCNKCGIRTEETATW